MGRIIDRLSRHGALRVSTLLVALMVALQLFGGWSLDARSEESEKPELARLADYSRVRAPPAPKSETQDQANAKSAGCMSCHTQVDSMTMHPEGNVVLGCTDCHGGDASVHVGKGLDPKSKAYAEDRDQAHVLPLYPKTWGYPSSANPKQSYTLLNKESPEFVRFKNPSDYRAARDACGACHLDVVHAGERSIMATDAMLLGGASYNNGILPLQELRAGRGLHQGRPAGEDPLPRRPRPADRHGDGQAGRAGQSSGALALPHLAGDAAGRHLPGVRAGAAAPSAPSSPRSATRTPTANCSG